MLKHNLRKPAPQNTRSREQAQNIKGGAMHPCSTWQGARLARFCRRIALGGLSMLAAAGGVQLAYAADAPALGPIVVGAPERIEVYPPQFKLGSTRAQMHVVVTGYYPGGGVQDLTRAAEFASTNEQ